MVFPNKQKEKGGRGEGLKSIPVIVSSWKLGRCRLTTFGWLLLFWSSFARIFEHWPRIAQSIGQCVCSTTSARGNWLSSYWTIRYGFVSCCVSFCCCCCYCPRSPPTHHPSILHIHSVFQLFVPSQREIGKSSSTRLSR